MRNSDEYFDGSNFQRLQSERAFSAHELIAGCVTLQSGYRRYRARITEISSDIKLPLSAKLLSAVRIDSLFLENYLVTWRPTRSIAISPAPHFSERTADERSEFPLIELLTVNTSRIYRARVPPRRLHYRVPLFSRSRALRIILLNPSLDPDVRLFLRKRAGRLSYGWLFFPRDNWKDEWLEEIRHSRENCAILIDKLYQMPQRKKISNQNIPAAFSFTEYEEQHLD